VVDSAGITPSGAVLTGSPTAEVSTGASAGKSSGPQAENVAAMALTTRIARADLRIFFIWIYPFGIIDIFDLYYKNNLQVKNIAEK
jgi:hypothetical protein